MSLHDTKTEYDLTSVPALDEDFSLEEILAEYGSHLNIIERNTPKEFPIFRIEKN